MDILKCACGRRRSKWATKCTQCYRTEAQESQAREQREMDLVNQAVQEGAEIRFLEPATQPHGRRLRYLYFGVPGVWAVDEDGHHWCMGGVPTRMLQQADNFYATGRATL